MMVDYVTDPELLKILEGDTTVTDPELIKQLEQAPSATETLSAPKSFWEDITAPNPPESFQLGPSLGRVGLSTAIGAGMGSLFPAIGTGVGAASGAFSGIAEEIARNVGASDITRVGAGALVGEVPAAIGPIARGVANVVSPASLPTARGVRVFESSRINELALKETQAKLFGKPSIDLGITPTYSVEAQQALRSQYLSGTPLDVGADRKVSDILRDDLYTSLKSGGTTTQTTTVPAVYDSLGMVRTPAKTITKEVPNVFATSPEFVELLKDFSRLKQRDRMTSSDITSAVKIVRTELSKDPKVRKTSSEDILNLIQNGGAYVVSKKGGETEIKTKIPEEARQLFKQRFDEYLLRQTGDEKYKILKDVERQEIIAKSRDEIPSLLKSGFKYGSDEYDTILNGIKTSPEGKRDFANALSQHLSTFDSSKRLLSEFGRIRKAVIDSGVLSRQQVDDFYNKIRAFDKTLSDKAKLDFIKSLLIAPLVGVAGAESAYESINLL